MNKLILKSSLINLPEVFTSEANSLQIEPEELLGLRNRLRYINELTYALTYDQSQGGLRAFIDRIELHAASCFDLSNPNGYSWWLAHSSWSRGGRNIASEFRGRNELLALVTHPSPTINDMRLFVEWADNAGSTLGLLLKEFCSSKSFAECISLLISMDCAIASILSSISKQRLFGMLSDDCS